MLKMLAKRVDRNGVLNNIGESPLEGFSEGLLMRRNASP